MRRLTLALLGVFLCVTLGDAQQPNTFRARWKRRPTGASAPTVSIVTPTLNPTHSQTAATVILTGDASDDTGIDSVAWACPTCTPTSGSCVQTTSWSCGAGGGGTLTVFEDNFNSASNAELSTHTPTPTGTSWTERIDTVGTNSATNMAVGYVQPAANALDTHILAYQAAVSPAITGTNYYVQATAHTLPSANDKTGGILFGYADTSNYCSVVWYSSSAAKDLVLGKTVAGTYTEIASSTTAMSNLDVVRVDVTAASLAVTVNGNSRISTSDTFCDNAVGVGLIWGDVRGADAVDDITTSFRIDDFSVVDQDAAGGTITLADGANVITVTATDLNSNTGTDVITVTKAASDTIAPEVTITDPVTSPTYATSASAITVSGTCTDNIACSSVTVACATCTPTNPSNTGTAAAFIFVFTAQSSGANTITVTGQDAAANSHQDVLTSTYTPADVTAPTVTITTNGGVNYSTSTTPQTIAGTCTDNVACTLVFCVSSVGDPGGTVATGGVPSGQWTLTYAPALGAQTLTCHGRDAAGNDGTDTIVVTFTSPVTITAGQTLPSATQSSAYSFSLASLVTGGTSPYTWTNNGAGTTLNDADAQCAGLSISSAGVISGTPTTAGACDWTSKATDSSAGACPGDACDTQTHTITVNAAGAEGPHDDFTTWCARADVYTRDFTLNSTSYTDVPACLSLRPDAAQTSISHARWANQLRKDTGYGKSSNAVPTWLTYNYAGDTYANKQDATKIVIPSFLPAGNLGAALDATQTVVTFTAATSSSVYTNSRGLKIDNEVMVVIPNTRVGNTVQVARGAFGTTAASHSNGAAVSRSNNSLQDGLQYPINTPGTNATYLFIWDVYYTPGWADTLESIPVKNFQLSSGNTSLKPGEFWYEPGIAQYPGSGWTPSDYSRLTNTGGLHVGAYRGRTYNEICRNATWALTTSEAVGPNAVGGGALKADATNSCPDSNNSGGDQVGKFSVFPDRWNRIFIKLQVVENDFDLISVYINDEVRDTVTISDAIQVSLRTNANGVNNAIENAIYMWWIEFNSSENKHNRPNEQDLVAYVRNFVMLENPADIATIIANKPVR